MLLLDAVPVKTSHRVAGGTSSDRFHVLVAAVVVWRVKREKDGTPRIYRDIRLRLARAMPTDEHFAWKLVLDELAPDFVIADGEKGMGCAIRDFYDPASTVFVPSKYHVQKRVIEAITQTSGAWVQTGGPRRSIAELDRMVSELYRSKHPYSSVEAWTSWWDELFARIKALGLPLDRVQRSRRNYETAFVNALPQLLANPLVPSTTGGLETLIGKRIDPVLSGRSHAFTNIERTNRLTDLVVLYDNDQLYNPHDIADRLRADADDTHGRAAPTRFINDPMGAGTKDRYESLLDPGLTKALAKVRGIK